MPDYQKTFDQLCQHLRHSAMLSATRALLEWDQQTKLPAAGHEFRSQQIVHFANEIFKLQTDPRVGEWLNELLESPLAADPHSDTGATIREVKREFERQTKLPPKLVEELAGLTSRGQTIWVAARKANDFQQFAPTLKRILELKRQQAAALGFDDNAYDPLLDEFEPRAKTAEVASVLEALRVDLVPLVEKIAQSKAKFSTDVLRSHFPQAAQKKFAMETTAKLGFDYSRGRLDTTHHPFCTEIGPHDCRITTRFDEKFFSSAFFGTLHEAGHGMYEQGLRTEWYGLPPGKYCGLGIHESQSRLWENLVGRRLSFWQHFYPRAQELFPESLNNVALADFYRAINHVQPSLIRVEADEATYNLHIIIRFELEQELLNENLLVSDLPAAWNVRYQKLLGITPPSDALGVLQDVHWSAGLIGYFPTYSIGTLFASQLIETAETKLGDLDLMFRRGEFAPLHDWLKTEIYQHGMTYSSPELRARVTKQPLSHEPLIAQLKSKLGPLYGW